MEISEDRQEEEPIIDLITRVEDFAAELLTLTKNLFAKYYEAKDTFFVPCMALWHAIKSA